MTRYRKPPVEVEAVQWTGENREEVEAFIGSPMSELFPVVQRDGWIVRDADGNVLSVLRAKTFEATYEPADHPAQPDTTKQSYTIWVCPECGKHLLGGTDGCVDGHPNVGSVELTVSPAQPVELDGLRGDVEIKVRELLERAGLESAPERGPGRRSEIGQETAWRRGRDDTLSLIREDLAEYIAKAFEEFEQESAQPVERGEPEGSAVALLLREAENASLWVERHWRVEKYVGATVRDDLPWDRVAVFEDAGRARVAQEERGKTLRAAAALVKASASTQPLLDLDALADDFERLADGCVEQEEKWRREEPQYPTWAAGEAGAEEAFREAAEKVRAATGAVRPAPDLDALKERLTSDEAKRIALEAFDSRPSLGFQRSFDLALEAVVEYAAAFPDTEQGDG